MIYLLDRHEKLLDIISETDLTEFVCQVSLNTFDEARFELPPSLYLEAFKQAHYFGFFHREVFKIFRIVENQVSDSRYVKGIDRAESDLRTVTIIKDKRPHNVTADQALTVALEGTGYRVGVVEGLPKVASTSFYYISPLEALVKIVDKWQCEFRVRYTFVENAVTGRYIDLYKSQGKVSGKQFYYGDNLLSVVHEESADYVVTALIGRGKGEELDSGGYGRRIEFTDVVWSKSSGKPTDKPAGQNYVVNDKARQLYGLSQNGTLHHRWGVFIDENIEDAEELLTATYAELERLSAPLTVFKANILSLGEDVWLGDSVAIIRDELKIAFEARVQKLVIDLLNFEQSEVILGDYQTLQHQQQRSEGQRLQQTLDERLSPYAQELQRFYERVETEKERRNAEIDEQFRLARLDFDNYKELAETKANDLKDELTSQINADLRPLADEAKRLADGAVSDLARQRQELEAVRSSVGTAKAEAITEATSQLNTARQELAGLVDGAKREARELVDRLNVGDRNYFLNSRGEKVRGSLSISSDFVKDFNRHRTVTLSVTVTGRNLQTRKRGIYGIALCFELSNGRDSWFEVWQRGTTEVADLLISKTWEMPEGVTVRRVKHSAFGIEMDGDISFFNPKLELGKKATPWTPAPEDFSYTIEQLDNGYREKFKEIKGNETERRTFQTEMEKTVDGFRTSISSLNQKFDSEGNLTELTRYKNDRQETDRGIHQKLSALETYKDGESDRSRAYFEASRDETARQLREERKAITESYVAKNTYQRDAQGFSDRFERVETGLNGKVSSTDFQVTTDAIKQSVRTLDGQVMKSSNFTIDANGLVLQSGREFNGSTITNLLTVNPDDIKAITDKMIITPAQRNLVSLALRANEFIISDVRDKIVSEWLAPEMFDEPLEFVVMGRALRTSTQLHDLWVRVFVSYTDESASGYSIRLAEGEVGNSSIDFEKTLKIPIKTSKTIRRLMFSLHQKVTTDFTSWRVYNLRIYHKTSASLLVNGSITAKQIASGAIETGHMKAGSVTAAILSADAVTASKLKVDSAFFDKVTAGDFLARRITASTLFATSVQAVELSADRIRSGMLSSKNGKSSFNLNSGQLTINGEGFKLRQEFAGRMTFMEFVGNQTEKAILIGSSPVPNYNRGITGTQEMGFYGAVFGGGSSVIQSENILLAAGLNASDSNFYVGSDRSYLRLNNQGASMEFLVGERDGFIIESGRVRLVLNGKRYEFSDMLQKLKMAS